MVLTSPWRSTAAKINYYLAAKIMPVIYVNNDIKDGDIIEISFRIALVESAFSKFSNTW